MYCFFPLCVETNHIYNKEIEEFPVFMQVYLCLMSTILLFYDELFIMTA